MFALEVAAMGSQNALSFHLLFPNLFHYVFILSACTRFLPYLPTLVALRATNERCIKAGDDERIK